MELPRSGERFDARYRLDEILGEGGYSRVYRAVQDDGRWVAIKILKPEPSGYAADTVARFEREVRAIGELRDPRTVKMYGSGKSGSGLLYAVFEYVPGNDLAELLQTHGPYNEESTVHILTQLLLSLREAHAVGLVHRDLKPENIRIFETASDALRVKLLDFGTAKPTKDTDGEVTRVGELVGTPRYMSPEQLMELDLTPASDIYSLGIVAYEMMTGRAAIHGNRWTDQLDRLASGHVFSLPELERVSAPVREILDKMSARRPEHRYQSVDEVLDALAGLAWNARGRELVDALREREDAPTQKKREILAALALIGLVVGVLVAALVNKGCEPERPPETIELGIAPKPAFVRDDDAEIAPPSPILNAPADAGASPNAASGGGCGSPPPYLGLGQLAALDGLDRVAWTTYVPHSYDASRRHPIMLLFRDEGQTPDELLARSGFASIADRESFVILAPEGSAQWRADVENDARRALAEAGARLCLDDARIYAVGQGEGGRGVQRLSCVLELRAMATNSFRADADEVLCQPPHPVPYIHFAALDDLSAPIEGGTRCGTIDKLSLETTELTWREFNGCKQLTETFHPGTCQSWACGDAPFVSCRLDGGRGWPGSMARLTDALECDGDPPDFALAARIWEFFDSTGSR